MADYPSYSRRLNIFEFESPVTPDDISGSVQTLSLAGDDLQISSGNTVDLGLMSSIGTLNGEVATLQSDVSAIQAFIDDISGGDQTLTLSGDVISLIPGGSSVDIATSTTVSELVTDVNNVVGAVATNTNKLAGVSVVAPDISDLEYTISDTLTVERVDGSATFIETRAEGQDHFQIESIRENPGVTPAQVKVIMKGLNSSGVLTEFLTRYSSNLVEVNTSQGLAVRDPILGTASQFGPDASGNLIVSGGMRLSGTINPIQTLAFNSGTSALSISDGNAITIPSGGGFTSLETIHNLEPWVNLVAPANKVYYNQWSQLDGVGIDVPITVLDGIYAIDITVNFPFKPSWVEQFSGIAKYLAVRYVVPLTGGNTQAYYFTFKQGNFYNGNFNYKTDAKTTLGTFGIHVENFVYPASLDTSDLSGHRVEVVTSQTGLHIPITSCAFQVRRTGTDTDSLLDTTPLPVSKSNGIITRLLGGGNYGQVRGAWNGVGPADSLSVLANPDAPERVLTDGQLNDGLPSYWIQSYSTPVTTVYPENHDLRDDLLLDNSAAAVTTGEVDLDAHTASAWEPQQHGLVKFGVEEHNVRHYLSLAGDASGNAGLVAQGVVLDASATYDLKFDYRKDAADLSENQVAGMVIRMADEFTAASQYDDQSYNLTHLTLFDASTNFDNSWHEISLPFDPREKSLYGLSIAHDGDASNSIAPVYVTNIRFEQRDPVSNPTLTLYRDAAYQTVIGDASLSLGEYPDITGWTNYGNGLTSFAMSGGDVSGQFVGYSEVDFSGDEVIVTKDTQDWDGDLSWNDTVKSFKFRLAPYTEPQPPAPPSGSVMVTVWDTATLSASIGTIDQTSVENYASRMLMNSASSTWSSVTAEPQYFVNPSVSYTTEGANTVISIATDDISYNGSESDVRGWSIQNLVPAALREVRSWGEKSIWAPQAWKNFNSDSYPVNVVVWPADTTSANIIHTQDQNSVFNSVKCQTRFTGDIQDAMSGVDMSGVTSLEYAFQFCGTSAGHITPDLSGWQTQNVTSLRQIAENSYFNGSGLNSWNTSNVTSLRIAFYLARVFNQPLTNWDVRNVVDALRLFQGSAMNSDVNGVNWNWQSMSGFFTGTLDFAFADTAFNQPLSNWNVSTVESIRFMFEDNPAFNQDITGWDTGSTTLFTRMFYNATAFNQDLSGWNVSSGTDFSTMFRNATSFSQDLSPWANGANAIVSATPNFTSMFQGATTQINDAGYTAGMKVTFETNYPSGTFTSWWSP
jgi:hypothetical protein